MFLTKRFHIAGLAVVACFTAGYLTPWFFVGGKVAMACLLALSAVDGLLLWHRKRASCAERYCAPRFSNGNDNGVRIIVESFYPFSVNMEIIDEIPVVFQRRDVLFRVKMKARGREVIRYNLRPVQRGVYSFGRVLLFVSTSIGLLSRRIKCAMPADVAVYPSYLMLHQYSFRAIHNDLTEVGVKKIRRTGHHTEFESIREYVKGDDYRVINWKASARRHFPMINVYRDERSQQIYGVIDKGRVMRHAFRGMTLLDCAINSALALSFVAIRREDKAGLCAFAERFETFLPAGRQPGQMQKILECLYSQQSTFGESDYSALYASLSKFINKRSLLIVYTNFDSLIGMERQMESLRLLARRHVVLAVFFEDVEMKSFADRQPESVEGYYMQVIADKFISDKRHIVGRLRQYGVYSLLTSPDQLTADVINKYLEMKSRGII